MSDPGSISGRFNQSVAMRILPILLAAVFHQCICRRRHIHNFAGSGNSSSQCYNGDDGKFYKVGEKATISGVTLVCEATSDKKNAQWVGVKHAK